MSLVGSIPFIGERGRGAGGHVTHAEVIRRCFYPVWQNQKRPYPVHMVYFIYVFLLLILLL